VLLRRDDDAKGDDFRAFFPSWGENRFSFAGNFVIFDS
jgi:hypothetical protein